MATILIAGGGIGGLCAALCLTQFGHDCCVLEQAPALTEVGAGIQISPNGMKVLSRLGLSERIAATAFAPEALEMRMGRSGRRVFRIALDDHAEARWGAPYLHIHRADLIEFLRDALAARAPGSLRLGTSLASYTQTEEGVTALTTYGERIDGDVLIGADGIHSAVREQMLGEERPVFTGNVAWRAVVPTDALGPHAPPPTACVWVGPGRHAVTYRLRGGALSNLVGVVEQDGWEEEGWMQRGLREDALADFAGWDPVVTTLIEKADTHYSWALFDRPPLARWVEGRVALIGDAAHPMLPFLAQGAVQAIEDAWVLAEEMSREDASVPSALRAYQDGRLARTAQVQTRARANTGLFHKTGPAAQLATYGPMWLAGHLAPGVVRSRQDWLYGHDVTKTHTGSE